MAPKTKAATKGTKRAAVEDVSKAAKAPRVDPAMQAVQDVIEQAEGLPESCKGMLLACSPTSLSVPKDMRIQIQTRIVEMIAEVVEGRRSSLQAAVDAEQSKVNELEASKSRLEEAVANAEAALKHASETLASKRLVVNEAVTSSEVASNKLKEAKKAQDSFDEQLVKIEHERRELQETVLATCLPGLCGDAFQADAATRHRDAIMNFLGRSTRVFESTLLMTLPEALIKAPTERGDFDKMAIETLQSNLVDHVEKLGGELGAAEDAKAARASAVQAAEEDVATARATEAAAKNDVSSAEETEKAGVVGLEAAKKERCNFEPSLVRVATERDVKQNALTYFEEHNVKYFTTLQNKTSTSVAEDFCKMGA